MSQHANMLSAMLRSGVPLRTCTLHQANEGTSSTEVFILHDVLKTGPRRLLQSEFTIYQTFEQELGSVIYQRIFPRTHLLRSEQDETWIMEVEWLGELLHSRLEHFQSSDKSPQQPDLSLVDAVIAQAITHLETLFIMTHKIDSDLVSAFFEELIVTLKTNLVRADQLTVAITELLEAIVANSDRLLAGVTISLCHRDLATDNIYVYSGREGEIQVKFADPRSLLPFLMDTDASSMQRLGKPGWGCAAADLAALWVSLYREEQELLHVHAQQQLTAFARVQRTVSEWVTQGRFTRAFFALNLAACISLYVSCKCEYCTAPARNWLYENMVEMCREQLEFCIKSI